MSNEIVTYKQNRIRALQMIYTANVSRIYNALAKNVRSVKNSRAAVRVKQTQINSLINQYFRDLAALGDALNKNKQAIQNFTPAVIKTASRKRALLVGINYIGTHSELFGCINDVNAIKERIMHGGFSDISIITDLTPKKPTRATILDEFKLLLSTSRPGDLLFFCYSGHGSYTLDRNSDETDGRDEMIVSCDLKGIVDDELKALIQTYLKPGATLFAMFDSCFSGSVLDLKYQYLDSLNYDNYTENEKQLETQGNVFMVSGCTDKQTSVDAFINNKASGAMTWSFLEAVKEKTSCTWRELIKSMRDKLRLSEFDQVPQFSSGTFVDIDAAIFI
jgi:hypothetical protein